jgi:hypothetical protein
LTNDSILDFDFDKWLNDIGVSGTPGAGTFLSPAPVVPPAANQDLSAVATLRASAAPTTVMQPPVRTSTFVANEIANAHVPLDVVMGVRPNAGMFGFAGGAAAGPSTSDELALALAAPDPRLVSLRAFFDDAKALYAEVEGWQDVVPLEERDARVLAGNRTHQFAMQVCATERVDYSHCAYAYFMS